MRKRIHSVVLGGCIALATMQPGFVLAATGEEARIQELERQMQGLLSELQNKQGSIDTLTRQVVSLESRMSASPAAEGVLGVNQDRTELKGMTEEAVLAREKDASPSKFSFGGYGEIHANFTEGSNGSKSNDKLDIHRLVALVDYNFTDWIKFKSEIELEHAYVQDTQSGEKSSGYLMLEQAHVDFLLNDFANVRFGRLLTPVGITNQRHEPTTFYGVERPTFDNVIIPSTWSADGIGFFGNLASNLSYEAYVVGGLDGSKFSSKGIRDGRIKDEPSLNDLALTFRFDYHPFMGSSSNWWENLRLGTSMWHGGIDNVSRGADKGIEGDLTIYSADFSTRIDDLDLKGVVAFEEIDGARDLNVGRLANDKVAEDIFGYYVEAGYHVMPEAWKTGRLKSSDIVVSVRYDKHDTQHKMVAGDLANPDYDRNDWTVGLSFLPVPNFVVKADYQIRESQGAEPDNLINFGMGWQF